MYRFKLKMKEITLQDAVNYYWRASRKWEMGNSPYLPIYIECVFRIQ